VGRGDVRRASFVIGSQTPTLPKTREEWGTPKAWKREPKRKSKAPHVKTTSGAPTGKANGDSLEKVAFFLAGLLVFLAGLLYAFHFGNFCYRDIPPGLVSGDAIVDGGFDHYY
jgi:hypothetical protein